MIFSIMIYILFIGLLIIPVRSPQNVDEPYCFTAFNSLRGLFALEIIIGHVIRDEKTLLYPLGKFMMVSVAYFFFVSAYGLIRSFYQKPDYLRMFLPSKCGYLISVSFVAFILRLLIVRDYNFDYGFIYNYITMTNWYIWELMFFYMAFWCIYKYLKRNQIICISIITVIITLVLYFLEFKQKWYCSAWAFPLGLVFYKYHNELTLFLKSICGKILILLMTVLGIIPFWSSSQDLLSMVILRNIMCLAIIGIMYYFLCYFTPPPEHCF